MQKTQKEQIKNANVNNETMTLSQLGGVEDLNLIDFYCHGHWKRPHEYLGIILVNVASPNEPAIMRTTVFTLTATRVRPRGAQAGGHWLVMAAVSYAS